ncbi:MAG TPA: UDP-N-acetylmuramate--L-alanine ligase [bacterium]|nr:UDP-N-acetylmuramate--L-alanine ligase [bacterium]
MAALYQDLIGSSKHVYLIGIGGVGMSALARILKYFGMQVSGSDIKASFITRELVREGIPVYLGQNQPTFEGADLIIYSSAIDPDHLELRTARQMGIKIYHRAEILSSLFNRAKTSIAVTGTHGKTTTSAMISFVLSELGKEPTCLVGGILKNLGSNTLLGNPELWVSEVDESDKSHELYAPSYAIITNLEEDHLDNYRDLKDLENSFSKFLKNPVNPGVVIYNGDDAILKRLVLESGKPALSYGLSPTADFSAENIQLDSFGSDFVFLEAGLYATPIKLAVPGVHNVANALAATTLLIQLGISPEEVSEPLSRFRGAGRRLEVKWQSDGFVIIDDYAHHPTEVLASIRALRRMGGPVTVVFQPHRFSRTQHFFKEFGRAFQEADELILTEIYGAGERNPEKIGVDLIYRQVTEAGHPSVRVLDKKDVTSYLLNRGRSRGIVAFLGAGDIGDIADEFANRFKSLAAA